MNEAIKPDKFNIKSPFVAKIEKEAVASGNSEEEIILSQISASDGWIVLTDEMDKIIEELDGSLSKLMETGADFDSIGKTAVVKELVKSYILRIKGKVGDASEAVRGTGGN